MESCATCRKFLSCNRPEKGVVCNKFKPWTDKQLDLLGELTASGKIGPQITLDSSFDSLESESVAENSMQNMLAESLSPGNAIPPDLKFDDRDIKQFPNFYEFCMSPKGLDQAPLPKQLVIYTHLFGEYCPKCSNEMFHDIRDFPTDYPIRDVKEHVTFLEFGKCPKCKSRKSELIEQGLLNSYQELALCCGQRAGKSIGLSLANAYIVHNYLKLQNPNRVYRQTDNTNLTGTFVGITFGRAVDLLFRPLATFLATKPFFQAYHETLDHYSEMYGEEVYKLGEHAVIYKHRQLAFYGASPRKRTLRGDTRCLVGADELGWFPFGEESNDREQAGADEVYEALDRSLLTIRNAYQRRLESGFDNIPNAIALYASSPQAYNDKIMSLVRSFQNSKYALGAHFASWEMNPDISRNDPAIMKAYIDNPIKAERDYGANPPMSDSAFIEDPSEFKNCFLPKRNVLGSYKYTVVSRRKQVTDSVNSHRRSAKFEKLLQVNGPCVLSIDAGASHNSFSLCLSKWSGKRPWVLGLMEIAPEPLIPLDHSLIYTNVIKPIIENCDVALVYADRWQSMKLLQDIEADSRAAEKPWTVEASMYSMKLQDFYFCMDWMRDKDHSPVFPKMEMDWEDVLSNPAENYPHCFKYQPVSHLLFQMATVRENRRTIDKGQGYTDDIFRALMLGLMHVYDEDVQAKLAEYAKLMSGGGVRRGGLGASSNYSSGSVGAPNSNGSSNLGGFRPFGGGR